MLCYTCALVHVGQENTEWLPVGNSFSEAARMHSLEVSLICTLPIGGPPSFCFKLPRGLVDSVAPAVIMPA